MYGFKIEFVEQKSWLKLRIIWAPLWSYWSLLCKLRALRSVPKCPSACWEGTCHGSPESGKRTQRWAEFVTDQEKHPDAPPEMHAPWAPRRTPASISGCGATGSSPPVTTATHPDVQFSGRASGSGGRGRVGPSFPAPCAHLLQARPQTAPGNSFRKGDKQTLA